MTLEHVAIWTNRLEQLKNFYAGFLNGTSSAKYINSSNSFESYFISFQNGARLELMQKPGIADNLNNPVEQYQGIIHLAFRVKDVAEVNRQAAIFRDLQSSGDPERPGMDIMSLKHLTRTIIAWKFVSRGLRVTFNANLQRDKNS